MSLAYTPHQAGDFVFTAAVETDAGERYLGNNAAQFPMRIDADPIRVLYVEGFLRYEYKYLKARLEDDPDVALVSVVRRVNPEGVDGAAGKDVLTADELKKMDVVILGDMEAKYLSPAEYQQLLRWLDEKNHSLLVLGGYKSFGPDGFRETPLADVLPVVFAAEPPLQSEEPFHLELTDKGQGHPIFTLSGDRVKDARGVGRPAAVAGHEPGAARQAGRRGAGRQPRPVGRGQAGGRGGGAAGRRRRPGHGADGRFDLALEPAAARDRPGRHALRPLLEPDGALAGRPRPRRTAAAAHRVHG